MAVDEKRWGMLFCPKQSARRSRKYLERLEKILAEKGVAYDLVQSESTKGVACSERLFLAQYATSHSL